MRMQPWRLASTVQSQLHVDAVQSLVTTFDASLKWLMVGDPSRPPIFPWDDNVCTRFDVGRLTLHGWPYVNVDSGIHVFNAQKGNFVGASESDHSGTGPYQPYVENDGQVLSAPL
jgi:hypothetical protein